MQPQQQQHQQHQQQQAPVAASAPYDNPHAHMHPHALRGHPPHAHPPSAAGPNSELLPPAERAFYDHLFQEALGGQQLAHGGHGAAFLHGPAAVAFLSRSGLPKPALRQVWALCDPQGHGFLARTQFHLAMRLVAMAQAGYIDPMDPTLPGRIQARDPLSVALPQLPPVRLAPAHEASAAAAAPALSPPMQPVAAPSAAPVALQQQMQQQPQNDEEEDEFGDFEGASTSQPPVQAAPAPIPSMPSPPVQPLQPMQPQHSPMAAVTVPALADAGQKDDDDFGDFHEAGAEEVEQQQAAVVVTSVEVMVASSSSSNTVAATTMSGAAPTIEAVAASSTTTTATVMATKRPTGGMTGLAVLSSSQSSFSAVSSSGSSSSSSSSSSSLAAPVIMAMAPAADIGARMAAFDAIVEEGDWGDFEEAEAPAAAPVAPEAIAAGGPAAGTDLLMGVTAQEGEGTTSQPEPALSFAGALSSGAGSSGGGGLLDLDLLAPPSTASTTDPFAAAAAAAAAPFGAPAVVAPLPALDALGGSAGGAGMSRFMTETPPSSPKAVQLHQYRSPSPPLPSIHALDLDAAPGAGGNPFASAALVAAAASSSDPFADAGAGGLGAGNDGGGSLVGLAGAGIGTGSIYEQSPYADPDAVSQGPSALLGASSSSPSLAAGANKVAEEKEDALTSAFRAVDAAGAGAVADVGFAVGLGGNGSSSSTSTSSSSSSSSSTSRSHTGPFSPLPLSVPAPSAAPAVADDPFGFSGNDSAGALPGTATASVFGDGGVGGGVTDGDDEWGAFNGGTTPASSTAPAPEPALLVSAPLAPVPVPAPASDDPFAGLQGDEEEIAVAAAGAIQHEEVSPSSRGSSSPDRPLGGKAVEAEAEAPEEQQAAPVPPPAAVAAAVAAAEEEEEKDEWGAFSTAKEEAPVPTPAPAPVVAAAASTSPPEPADPWSHPDPWGAAMARPVAIGAGSGGGGGMGGVSASGAVGSILLDPLHVASPLEPGAMAAAPTAAHSDGEAEEDGGLEAVLPRLWAKGLLGSAAALTEHLEARRALPGVTAACEAAKREDRLEEALALKRRVRELEGRVAGEAQLAAWRALGAEEDEEEKVEGDDALLRRLWRQVAAGAGPERAEAFAGAFIAGQLSLAAQARAGDARGALRRARRARRCAALVVGMAAAAAEGGGGPLAAYPQHWRRTLATATGKLGEAAAFCRRVAALPSAATRQEVGASLKVRTFVEAALEILRVARFVRATAGDALLELDWGEEEGGEEGGGVEALAAALRAALGAMGLEAAVAGGWPLEVGAVRDAVADCGGEEEEAAVGEAAPAVDPRSVCNLCLLPLAAARALGGGGGGGGGVAHAPVPVTYFSGAAYHSACCNLWINAISLETPQPVSLAGAGSGLRGMGAGGLSGDAMMDGSTSGRVSVESGGGSNGGDAAADGVVAPGPAAVVDGKALEAEVPF